MGRRFHYEQDFQNRSLELYFLGSSVVGLLIFCALGFIYPLSYLVAKFPLTICFATLSITTYINCRPNLSTLNLFNSLPLFFMAQFFLLMGMSVELNEPGPLFMSVLPILAALFSIQSHWFLSATEKWKKSFSLLAISLVTSPLAFIYNKDQSSFSFFLFATYFSWQVGVVYLANLVWLRQSRKFLNSLLRKGKQEENTHSHLEDDLNKERYFFHDVINHTHGMNLMLRARMMKNIGLTPEETRAFSGELFALQSVIKEHFGLAHKNMERMDSHIAFRDFKKNIINVVESFFPDNETEFHFNFNGTVAPESEAAPFVPFVPLHRILTNLIKNCAEANAKKIEITFSGDELGLTITVVNDLAKLERRDYELGNSLAQIIQNGDSEQGKQDLGGLGLEAVASLCTEWGGHFDFSLSPSYWTSIVRIPFREEILTKSPCKGNSLESQKKVA